MWIAAEPERLSDGAREAYQDPGNDVYLSSVSAWEIALKNALGKLPLPHPPDVYIPDIRRRHAIEPLLLDEDASLHLAKLPDLHKDPFDRMLVCQAMVEGMTILTPDLDIRRYPVRTLW